MPRSRMHFSSVFVAISFYAFSATANTPCGAILSQGIFDTAQTLNTSTRYQLAMETFCRSGSRQVNGNFLVGKAPVGLSYEDFNSFCSSQHNQLYEHGIHAIFLRTANDSIINAWSECESGRTGLSHYITTTPNPQEFIYTITYRSDGQPLASTITDWQISDHVQCTGQLVNGTQLHHGQPRRFQCRRSDAAAQVIVTVEATVGATGAESIVLPGYINEPAPKPACEIEISIIKDDHYTSQSHYNADIEIEGRSVFSDAWPAPHGEPFGQVFSNWQRISVFSPYVRSQNEQFILGVKFQGPVTDHWIALDYLRVRCEDGVKIHNLTGFPNYSVMDPRSVLVIYGGREEVRQIN